MKETSKLVVDTSVVVKWFVNEENSELASQLFQDAIEKNVEFHVPGYLKFEFLSVLRKYTSNNYLSREQCKKIIELFAELPLVFHEFTDDDLLTAFEFSLRYHISFYDAIFIVLADALKTRVITADQRLVNSLKKKNLVLLTSYKLSVPP